MGRILERTWVKAGQALCASYLRRQAVLDGAKYLRFAIAALAVVSGSLGALQLAVVLVSPAWFETLCSVSDSSPYFAAAATLLFASPIVATLLMDYGTIGREPWPLVWQGPATRAALFGALANVVAETFILRGPWLLGKAGRFDRVHVWTATLSSTYGGVPCTAFCLSLGYGVTLWCVTSAFVRAYGVAFAGARERKSHRIRALAWVWCALLFVTGFVALCSFATGGAV